MGLVGGGSTLPFTVYPFGGKYSELEAGEEGDSLAFGSKKGVVAILFLGCGRGSSSSKRRGEVGVHPRILHLLPPLHLLVARRTLPLLGHDGRNVAAKYWHERGHNMPFQGTILSFGVHKPLTPQEGPQTHMCCHIVGAT